MWSRERWAMFFPKCASNKTQIKETIQREEEAFNRTLDKGIELFEREVADSSRQREILRARFAFQLYDDLRFSARSHRTDGARARTHGRCCWFRETDGRAARRARARRRKRRKSVLKKANSRSRRPNFSDTIFSKPKRLSKRFCRAKESDEVNIVLDRTPVYAEMGGQVGDRGLLHVPGHDRTEVGQLARDRHAKTRRRFCSSRAACAKVARRSRARRCASQWMPIGAD